MFEEKKDCIDDKRCILRKVRIGGMGKRSMGRGRVGRKEGLEGRMRDWINM